MVEIFVLSFVQIVCYVKRTNSLECLRIYFFNKVQHQDADGQTSVSKKFCEVLLWQPSGLYGNIGKYQ